MEPEPVALFFLNLQFSVISTSSGDFTNSVCKCQLSILLHVMLYSFRWAGRINVQRY